MEEPLQLASHADRRTAVFCAASQQEHDTESHLFTLLVIDQRASIEQNTLARNG